jgi:hypothetical protein
MGLQLLQELSDEELDRIERRSEAATVGPWYSYVVGRDSDAVVDCIELGSCNELGSCGIIELAGASVADQDFIAHARQDLPRLLREVRTLRARMRSLGSGQGRQAVPGEGDGGHCNRP